MTRKSGKRFDLLDSEGALAVVLLAPAVVIIFGVLLFPMLSSLALSFTDLKMTKPDSGHFVGLDNFVRAFKSELFWASLERTGVFTVFTVAFEMVLGLAVALLLNAKFKGRAFVRGLIILPWALPYVVNGVMWKWIFDANYGVLNAILTQLGWMDEYKIWLGDPSTAMSIVVAANIWKETPVAILMLLAALQSMSKDMVEAASIDGANRWTIFRQITLPFLKPMILTLIVIKVIWALKEFDLIYVMTKGGPANATNLFSYHVYQNTFQFLDFGYGSALAYLLTLLAIVLSLSYMKASQGDKQ